MTRHDYHDFGSPAKSEALRRMERAIDRAFKVVGLAVVIFGLLVFAGLFLAGLLMPLASLIAGTH